MTKKAAACFVALLLASTLFAQDTLFNRKNIVKTMERVADWQLNSWKDKGFTHQKYDWTNGACYAGLFDLGKMSKKNTYLPFLVSIGNDLDWNTGPRKGMADDYCIGQLYANLYTVYKEPKMIAKWRVQADSIIAAPHTESLEWKNKISLREWAWCDALFMGPPALGYLTSATKDPKYLDGAAKLWWKTTDYLYVPTEQLYFRDQTFFEKKEANGQKVFWSRGNGWVMGGLVRVLDNMPAKHPDRKQFIKLYKDMAAKIAALQQPDGSWHASLLDPASYPPKETSGTGFYTYAILWGLNNGTLDKKTYWPVVKKAWAALATSVHPDGMLGYVQRIGAAPDKVDENSTEVYGVGAFLLAGTQLCKYLDHNKM
ncbi:glycoside hydrolase family 105 protein [Mucilaginibacter sp. AW1-3]